MGAAFLITVLHLCVMLAGPFAGGPASERYYRLVQHDSYWFMNIVDRGYQSPVPPSPTKRMEVSNVAFFPGFPLLAGALVHGFGFYQWAALPFASQLATWGFWTYFLLTARRLGLGNGALVIATAAVISHPAAFFLIAGYSESLFLFCLLGFLFWSARGGRLGAGLAVLHGVGMTGTRIAGAPAAFAPALRAWAERARGAGRLAWLREGLSAPVSRALVLGLVALAGMLAFFTYCHLRWGHWDFYMMTQEAGWGVRPDYLALLKPGAYVRWFPDWDRAPLFGQFLVTATVAGYLAIAWWEISSARRRRTRWRDRLPLHFTGFVLFALAVSGVYSVRLESMTRYQFCTHVFLVLGVAHALADIGPERSMTRRLLATAGALAALLGILAQWRFASQFARAEWVA